MYNRRESEPAGLREDGDLEELRPDIRSDSAPATAAPFSDGAGKPPKCPPGSWRSNSDTSQSSAKGGRSYKRSLSDEHLMSPVSLSPCDLCPPYARAELSEIPIIPLLILHTLLCRDFYCTPLWLGTGADSD